MSPISIFQKFLSFDILPIAVFLLSIGLQLAAAVYALILIRITGRKLAWILISLAILLMAGRRLVSLISIITSGEKITLHISEWIALIISCLMLIGAIRIKGYFRSIYSVEASLKEAQKIAHLGNWDWDIVKNKLWWSDEIYHIFGLAPQEFRATYEAFLNSVHPDDVEFVKKSVSEALYEKRPYSIDHRIVLPDGTVKIVHEQAKVIYDKEDKPIRMVGTVQDITERKKAEEEIQKLSSNLNAIVEHIPQGVFLLDAENRIVLANPLATEYLAELSKAKIGDVLTHIAGCPVEKLLISSPQKMWHEIEINEPSHRIFEIAVKPIKTNHGGTVFVIRDITEERRLQDRIQSQERLATVGQLAAGIAHDFNNLLTGIIGFADLLSLNTSLPPDSKQMIDIIRQNGQIASELIKQILDFSRKSPAEMGLIDLRPLTKEFLRLIKKVIPENIHVSYSIDNDDEYIINADITKIQQVIMNLAINARDAMPEGGELKLCLSHVQITDNPPFPEMPSGDWVVITVSDTGMGIPPEVLPHIFEPFFTTKEKGKGTGLGLAQVYGIVKQHNGYIDVQTELRKGTTFTIYLPPHKADTAIPTREKEVLIPRGHGETILIAEDNDFTCDFIKHSLIGLGYRVLTADNGKDAQSLFEAHHEKINLVITDIVMPEMDGIELSKTIKKINPSIKILGISGYDLSAERNKLLMAGIKDIIQKPLSLEKLAQSVFNALDNLI